jgi:hypothetical protein
LRLAPQVFFMAPSNFVFVIDTLSRLGYRIDAACGNPVEYWEAFIDAVATMVDNYRCRESSRVDSLPLYTLESLGYDLDNCNIERDFRDAVNKMVSETIAANRNDSSDPAKKIIEYRGLRIGLQFLPGDVRHGRKLRIGYGHIQKHKGTDGMALDCYVGANLDSDRIYVVSQLTQDGDFDEEKVMIGFSSMLDAQQAYLSAMPSKLLGSIHKISMEQIAEYRTDAEEDAVDVLADRAMTDSGKIIDRWLNVLQGELEKLAAEGVSPKVASKRILEMYNLPRFVDKPFADLLQKYMLMADLYGRDRAMTELEEVQSERDEE